AKSKARLSAYEKMLEEGEREKIESVEIHIPPGPRLGDVVVEASHVTKSYDGALLFDDLSFNLPPGGIVGVIGANGAGKTTLFRIMTGQEKSDGGKMRIGDTVKFAYVDQMRDALAADRQIWEEISDGKDVVELGKKSVPARAYAATFNFK